MARDAKNQAGTGTGHQQGRQQGQQTQREAFKSNSRDFFRHPGQGKRGTQGRRTRGSDQSGENMTGSDTRKLSRPEQER